MHKLKKSLIRTAIVMAISASAAHAATVNNNFTMLDNSGELVGGTNNVTFDWNGSLNTSPASATSNASLSSPTPFFGLNWTAYNVTMYGPGSYTISTADTTGGAGCPNGLSCASGGNYSVNVASDSIMGHMKFAWGGTEGIDVINVWKAGDWSALNGSNAIFTGPGGAYSGPTYDLVSVDWNGDGVAGGGMIDGPFQGFNANFNMSSDALPPDNGVPPDNGGVPPDNGIPPDNGGLPDNCLPPSAVPVPAAFWLFSSGLIGLYGIMRRRDKGSKMEV